MTGVAIISLLLATAPGAEAAPSPDSEVRDTMGFVESIRSCVETWSQFPFVVIHWEECPVVV